MGKYASLERDVFDIFAQSSWSSENITTVPNGMPLNGEGIVLSIVPSGRGINLKSAAGILIIDIYIPAGVGPSRASAIADRLDYFISGKVISGASGKQTQFFGSSMTRVGVDKDNPKLERFSYTVSFQHFEV